MEALLRKYPKSQLVKALKAFCAAHLNKKDTAEKILEDIIQEGPQDERVLHTMTFVYKVLPRNDMLSAYKAAVEKRPLDPDVRIGLCGHYIRQLEYIQQQQESFKLAKIDPENAEMYVWWSICSLVMQSCSAAAAAKSFEDAMVTRLLHLAYTMADQRRQKVGKISFEKFCILCEILCGLGRHSDAVELAMQFDEICQDKVPEPDILMMLGTLYIRTGSLEEASKTFLSIALRNPQHWVAWHAYLATKLPEFADSSNLPLERVHGGIAEVWDGLYLSGIWQQGVDRIEISLEERVLEIQTALDDMIKQHEDQSGMKRPLALAQLEAAKYYSMHTNDLGHLSRTIIQLVPGLSLFSSFGADLRGYLCLLDDDNKKHVVTQGTLACTRMAQEIFNTDETVHSERKAFVCEINGYMLQSETGVGFSDAMDMIKAYYQNTHLVKDYDPKDRGLGEELLVTAIVPLIQSGMASKENIEHLLVLALVFIERAQMERTVSAPLRLAASALYGLLGAQSLATSQFSRLDIKGVLHDSLTGHWLLPILTALCPTEELCRKWFDGIVNLHTVQEMEARDALFTTYEQQTFSKVPEFVDFIKCLNQSSTFYLYKSEKSMLELRNQCILGKPLGQSEKILIADEIIHNDDLTVRPFWYPPSSRGPASEVLIWWELDQEFPGKNFNWWLQQGQQGSRERQTWETSVNQQIVSRLQFPFILSSICSAKPLESQDVLDSWLQNAVQCLGLRLDLADPADVCEVASSITTLMDSSLGFSRLAECLTSVTILFGYHTHLFALGSSDKDSELRILNCLKVAVSIAIDKVNRMCRQVRPAGIILLAQLSQEAFIWIAQVLRSFILHCKQNGPWKHMNMMIQELNLFAESYLSAVVSINLDAIYSDASRVEYAEALQQNHMYIQGLEYLEGFDLDEWLSKLNQSQTLVCSRIKESLQHIESMLKVFVLL